MRQPRSFSKDSFWHVLNRGVAKESIFREKGDFIFYLYKIKELIKKYPVGIHCYNFIPNHVHYLLKQTTDVPPGKFIGSLHTSLGIYINKKYSRSGHLFQDRYKARPLGEEALLPVSVYINLNKVLEQTQHVQEKRISKNQLNKLLEEATTDPWSSYAVYLGLREDGITDSKFILSLLSDDIQKARKEYKKLAEELITSGFFLKTRGIVFD
ncbi:MAG: transposase [Parcubacteria group bacterium Gr01-1014_30]|nr:MAG: transposase [Parcubacteria group bacterium Gr01-1014_30]